MVLLKKSLVDISTQKAVLNELSGERAKDFVIAISRFDRVQASQGTYQCMEMVKNKLHDFGINDVVIDRFPADGQRKYWTWPTCMGWNIRMAELWMTTPEKQKLADYHEIPVSVVRGSQSANVKAELIDVGGGVSDEDYQNKDVAGKIVLAGGPVASSFAGQVVRAAVIKRGALGVVVYLNPELDTRKNRPDLIPYYGMWNNREENDAITFGFCVSFETAMQLKQKMQQNTVKLHAVVDGENYESTLDQMMATIPGQSTEQEVLFVAHMDHYQPGAVDNASGCAALLEIARTLQKLIERGDLPAPKRTIRFLWPTEFHGMCPWLQKYPEICEKTLAAINCDMVGGDLVKTQSFLNFIRTPYSRAHYINDVVENLVTNMTQLNITSPRGNNEAPFNYRIQNYSGGSDHWFLNDNTIGIPSVMLAQKDIHYHTAQDVPDNIDATQLKRVMFIALNALWYIANAESSESLKLSAVVTANSMRDLANAGAEAISELNTATKDEIHQVYYNAIQCLQWETYKGRQTIASVAELDPEDQFADIRKQSQLQLQNTAQFYMEQIQGIYQNRCKQYQETPQQGVLSEDQKRAQSIIPTRDPEFQGPLSFHQNIAHQMSTGASMAEMQNILDMQFEIINLVDGKNSVLDICNAVSAQFGLQSLSEVEGFLKSLESSRFIKLTTIV